MKPGHNGNAPTLSEPTGCEHGGAGTTMLNGHHRISGRWRRCDAPKPAAKTAPRKHRGSISELSAVIWLMEQGYEVFRNVSPHGDIDVIARNPGDGHLIFIDVKTIGVWSYRRADGTTVKSTSRECGRPPVGVRYLFVHRDGKPCEWDEFSPPPIGTEE